MYNVAILIIFLLCNPLCRFGNVTSKICRGEVRPKKAPVFLKSANGSCMPWGFHKPLPTAERSLEKECKLYEKNSCCTQYTSASVHMYLLYNDQRAKLCPPYNVSLSDECRRHFWRHLCYFECSPTMGAWMPVESVDRYVNLPLCKEDCDWWFEDCKNDFVCYFWYNFQGNRLIRIPMEQCFRNECVQFKDAYSSPEDMCEMILGDTWRVTEKDQCISLRLTYLKTNRKKGRITAVETPIPLFPNEGLTSDEIFYAIFISVFVVIAIILIAICALYSKLKSISPTTNEFDAHVIRQQLENRRGIVPDARL